MSTLIVKNLDAPTGESIVAPDLQLPSGSVVQVVTEMYSTATYISGTTGAIILSASITPTDANNSILISATVHGLSDHRYGGVELFRGSVNILKDEVSWSPARSNSSAVLISLDGNEDGESNNQYRSQTHTGFYLDANHNSSTQVTYSLKARNTHQPAGNLSINAPYYNSANYQDGWVHRAVSSITLMEIAG